MFEEKEECEAYGSRVARFGTKIDIMFVLEILACSWIFYLYWFCYFCFILILFVWNFESLYARRVYTEYPCLLGLLLPNIPRVYCIIMPRDSIMSIAIFKCLYRDRDLAIFRQVKPEPEPFLVIIIVGFNYIDNPD